MIPRGRTDRDQDASTTPVPGRRRLGLPPPPRPGRGFGGRWTALVAILTAAAALLLLSMLATLVQRHLEPQAPTAPDRALPIHEPFEIPIPPPPPQLILEEPDTPLPELAPDPVPPPTLQADLGWLDLRPDLEIRPLDLPQPTLEGLLQPPPVVDPPVAEPVPAQP